VKYHDTMKRRKKNVLITVATYQTLPEHVDVAKSLQNASLYQPLYIHQFHFVTVIFVYQQFW